MALLSACLLPFPSPIFLSPLPLPLLLPSLPPLLSYLFLFLLSLSLLSPLSLPSLLSLLIFFLLPPLSLFLPASFFLTFCNPLLFSLFSGQSRRSAEPDPRAPGRPSHQPTECLGGVRLADHCPGQERPVRDAVRGLCFLRDDSRGGPWP